MKRKILIVDDNQVDRIVLKKYLSDEYEIMEASSGKEALALFKSNYVGIAAIILDIIMPEMDGYDVLKQIRANAVFQAIPIIVATSMDSEETYKKAIEYGANGFVAKPYNHDVLLHTLRNTIKLRETAAMLNAVWKDKLTGLLTREAFFREGARLVKKRELGYYTISCFDVDNFKVVNDQYGTDLGDKVLIHIAACLDRVASRYNGLSCRLSADRFAIIFPTSMWDSEEVNSAHNEINSPPCINRNIKIKIGRYIIDDISLSINEMYDRAFIAQKTIKGRYDTYIAYYDDSMRIKLLREQEIINDMEDALINDEFEPWYQPQFNHATGAIIGAEALVRWKKEGQYLSPAEFVPIFERNGFIYRMDQYIWAKVCKQLKEWREEGKKPLPISINISRCDLFHDDFIENIKKIVDKYDTPYDLIRLEVTESAFSEDNGIIIEKVNSLVNLGFTVEIDDFGSGYSSLNTLKDVMASILKIDMKFFENTENQERGGNIIESVVRMAKWLGMAIIAEGVEEKEQADYLKTIGCYYIQGYFYAKPMPATEYESLVSENEKEHELTRLKTLDNLNNSKFWDPKSMETLIFNSYVGGACIIEKNSGGIEVLRINDRFLNEFRSLASVIMEGKDLGINGLLNPDNRRILQSCMQSAIDMKKEASCEIYLSNAMNSEYITATLRVIARAAERYLYYCVINNVTDQRNAERQRSESAKKLQIVMANINGGVSAILIDDEGKSKLVFNNEKYYELYGYTKEQAEEENLDVMTLIDPEDFPKVLEKIKKLKKDKEPLLIDYAIKKRDGSRALIRANASLMSMEGYGDEVITSVLSDITEKKSLESQLQALITNINGGVSATVVRNGEPEFVVVNDRFFQILGYESREQYEKELPDKYTGVHPDDRERIIQQFESSDGGKKQYTMEYRVIRRDGEIRYIRNNISVVYLFGIDEPVQLSVANDITEQRIAEIKERNLSQQLSNIMDNINGGITATVFRDNNHINMVFSNDGFYQLYGYTKEQLETEVPNVLDLIVPEDRERTMETVARIVKNRGSETYEYRCKKRDGSIMWTRCTNSVMSLEGIGDTVLLAITADVTEQKKSQEQQIELLDNLAFGAALYEFNGKVIKVIHLNKRYWELVERKGQNFNDINVMNAVHPDDTDIISIELAAAIRQGRNAEMNVRILCGESGYKSFHITAAITKKEKDKYLIYASYAVISEDTMSIQEMIPIALSTMMSTVDEISYVKDKDLRYICCSEALVKMIGLTSNKEVIGKSAYDLFENKYADKFTADDQKVIETGLSTINLTEKVLDNSGMLRLLRSSKHPIMDAKGNTIGVYCISHDVTRQREKESQLKLLTSTIPGGLAAYSITKQGIKTLYFNEGYYEYSGHTREEYLELVEKEPLALMLPEDRPKMLAMIREFVNDKKDGKTGNCTYRCMTKDGKTVWMEMKAVLSEIDEDRFVLNVVQLDITEQIDLQRKQIELLDNLPCGAALFEFNGEKLSTIHLNKRYGELVNREIDSDSTNASPMDAIYPDDRGMVIEEIKEAIKNNRNAQIDIRILHGKNDYGFMHLDARITKLDTERYILYVTYAEILEEEINFNNILPFIFSTIMKSSTDLAFAKDNNFRYMCASKTFLELVGIKNEKDLIGKTDYDFFPKEIADMFRKDDFELLVSEQPQIDITESIPSPDGKQHYTRTSKHLLKDMAGEIVGIYGVGRDITETRQAYKQLSLLTNSISGGLATFSCTADKIITTYYNDGLCQLVGYSRGELKSATIDPLTFVIEEDLDLVKDKLHELYNNKAESVNFICRICIKGGGYKWASFMANVADYSKDLLIINAVIIDVTEQQEEKELLRLHEEEYRLAIEHANRLICRYNIKDKVLKLSKDVATRLSLPEHIENIPYSRVQFISEDTRDAYISFYESILKGEKESMATFHEKFNNGWKWIGGKATTTFDSYGNAISAVISFADVTVEQEKEAIYKKWQQNLSDKDQALYTLFTTNLNKDGSYDTKEGKLLDFLPEIDKNKSFNDLVNGFAREYVLNEDKNIYLKFLDSNTMLASYYRGIRADAIEFRMKSPEGKILWIRLSVELVEYPNSTDILAYLLYEDITKDKNSVLKIIQKAETDPLTGILNRASFENKVNEIINSSKPGIMHGLLMMDIDEFKLINDILGHSAGDEALTDFAELLRKTTRKNDLVGRLGGDEFVVLLSDISGEEIAEKKAKQICELSQKNISREVRMSSSIGIAIYPYDGNSFSELYQNADEALYYVKKNGKNSYAVSLKKE